jgi:ankyrin repeat protein
VKLLVESGAEINTTDSDGKTALARAQGQKNTAVAEWLKTAGAE